MQTKPATYASLLAEVLKDKSEQEAGRIAERFAALLKRRGDMKLAGAVLAEFNRIWEAEGKKAATAVTATALEAKTRQVVEDALKDAGYTMQEEVDHRVEAGMAVFLGSDCLIDATLRGKFHKLLKEIS